jgi:hypothetical protein
VQFLVLKRRMEAEQASDGGLTLSPPDDELVSTLVDMVIALIEVQPAPED